MSQGFVPSSTAILVQYWANIQPIWNIAHYLGQVTVVGLFWHHANIRRNARVTWLLLLVQTSNLTAMSLLFWHTIPIQETYQIANVNFLYDDIVHDVQNTIGLYSCINSATDRHGYVFEHSFTKFSEITQCSGHYAVQGHWRSPNLVPIESTYTTFY